MAPLLCGCPGCAYGRGNRRRRELLTNMPPEAYGAYREGVLKHLLYTLSEFDPVAFPRAWVKEAPPPVLKGLRRQVFRDMCACVREGGSEPLMSVAWRLHALGQAIGALLGSRHRAFRFVLEAQLKEMVGIDSMYHTLHWQLVQIAQTQSARLPSLRDFALHTGSVYAMLGAIRGLQRHSSVLSGHPQVRAYLRRVAATLAPIVAQHERRTLALAMALHGRLGASSGLARLGADLLPLCVPRPGAVRRCGDVLAPWLYILGE